MRRTAPLALSLLLWLGCATSDATPTPEPQGDTAGAGGPIAHGGPMGSATETNVAPIRCDVDEDCGEDKHCARESPDAESGTCARGAGAAADEDAGASR
jgi:hypothetical protein